jgi:hypothetical protein
MTPIPVVIVHRDALDLAAALSAVFASAVALIALGAAYWSVRHGDKALLRERRMTFELGVLTQLAHACSNLWNASHSEVLALIALMPGELDGLRREVEERVNGPAFSGNEQVLMKHWDEYRKAVDKRAASRQR